MAIWRLAFRHSSNARGARGPLHEALPTALPGLAPFASEWSGNPRDFYSRTAELRGTVSGVRVEITLGREGCMDAGDPDPSADDFGTPSAALWGDDVQALDALWSQLSAAFAAAGYVDETLWSAPGPIVEHLEAAGRPDRARALQRDVTDALVRHKSRPDRGGVAFAFARPDDWSRVLGAVASPESVATLDLSGNGLRAIPPEVARFTRLRKLMLTFNQLESLGPEPAMLPQLEALFLDGNPLAHFDRAEVQACRSLKRLNLPAELRHAEIPAPVEVRASRPFMRRKPC